METMASIRTNRPATSGKTLQLMSRTIRIGFVWVLTRTTQATTRAARQVGNPRSLFKAEAASRMPATIQIPMNTSLPAGLSRPMPSPSATAPESSRRKYHRKTMYVAAIENTDGNVNAASQCAREGMRVRNTTRLAGLEMGSTNEAALAISAHAKRYGNGSAFDLRTAENTAGVNTTAVASLDMKIV